MTENDAIKMLEQGDKYFFEVDFTYEECLESIEMGRKALEEIQQYRAIGTVEEFKALKEKNELKKPITYTHTHRADCPNCRATVRGIDKPFGDYCSKCGIKLDWSE